MNHADQNQNDSPERAIHTLDAPIFLTGFMGSGKSTVGQALADLLGRPFIDLDTRIEAITNRSIPDIIASDGEERFRQLESETLREIAKMSNSVIALGGGAITREENRRLILDEGISVWLDAPFELCWQRIQQDENIRPLAPDETTARARFEARRPLYEQSLLHTPVSESQSSAEIAEEILRQLGSVVE
ncbi:MAG TPA: shikimate kinase [Blastocatellia bacterium]|nr:shikimate kinase [Blastocatellia bacterium]